MATRYLSEALRRSMDVHGTSMRMSEVITNTCEVIWGSNGAVGNVTTTAATDHYKIGTKSAKHVIAAGFTTGIVAWDTTATAAINFATAGYTHVKFWVQASVALAAGVLTFGLDNAVDFSTAEGAGHRSTNIPAIAVASTWYRIIIPLTANQMALTSVDSFGITAASDPGAVTVYIDDVRFCKYDQVGDEAITLPSVCALNNTDQDGINTDVWQLPYRSHEITVHKLPVDLPVTYYDGAQSTWASTDKLRGTEYLQSGQIATDLHRQCTSISFVLGSDLSSGQYVSMQAVG